MSSWRRWYQKYAREVTFELWFEECGIFSLTEKMAGGQIPMGRTKLEQREYMVSQEMVF